MLQHDELFKQEGIEGLMTPSQYTLAWSQYQQWLVDKLNQLTVGTQNLDSIPALLTPGILHYLYLEALHVSDYKANTVSLP